MRIHIYLSAYASALLLLTPATSHAEIVTATCYEPRGPRVDYINGKTSEERDGYSNSNPTFFFTSSDSKHLIESWQAALPFPELIKRPRVDEIAPPSVSKSIIIHRTDSVIHAVSKEGREAFTTTLYLKDGFGIFTRIRVEAGGLPGNPMGAIYTAKCSIKVMP